MASKEEVAVEVEAVEAVYGDDCVVLQHFPPHLHVHIKPRTADDSSQQFVEATIGIRASSKYPDKPPVISVVDSKGLDMQRQNQLVASIKDRAVELSSCLMIVALVEEAVENLSRMNHPDGVCPLCLFPLLDEEEDGSPSMPFMKLMSCFHCFHCECIIRWYNWLQTEEGAHVKISEKPEANEDSTGVCPVCRKVFLAKDIEHVLDLAGAHPDSKSDDTNSLVEEDLVLSESENIRRLKFKETLKLQQEKGGLIEPKKHEVLLPGMFLPPPPPPPEPEPSITVDKEATGGQGEDSTTVPSGPSNTNNRPSTSRYRNSPARKQSYRGRGRGHRRSSWDQQPREEGNWQPREEGNWQPRGEGNWQPRGEGNWQPRKEGNWQPREEGNWQPREEGNWQPREERNWQPREWKQGDQQSIEQGDKQPIEQVNQQAREQVNRQPREWKHGNQQPREQGNRQPREWKQGNQRPREQGNQRPREQGNQQLREQVIRQPREWKQGNRKPREQGNQQPRPIEQGKQKESGAPS